MGSVMRDLDTETLTSGSSAGMSMTDAVAGRAAVITRSREFQKQTLKRRTSNNRTDMTNRTNMVAAIAVLAVASVAVLTSGCRTAGGRAESLHEVETYNPTNGMLISREVKRDTSYMGLKGLFASDAASALEHSRSNALTGASAETRVGKFSGKPEAAAITAAGGAVGAAANAIMGNAVGAAATALGGSGNATQAATNVIQVLNADGTVPKK